MISFKKFVDAIHEAILSANDKISDRNDEIFDKYFEESLDTKTGEPKENGALTPKSVIVEYPFQNHKGEIEITEVSVPLITLDKLQNQQIEKAILKADFDLSIVNDEVQLSFSDSKKKKFGNDTPTTKGTLEIIISPQENAEGLQQLVEGYEAALKGQISSS